MNNSKFKCGMYGGSFNPLHVGHLECMIKAAGLCENLIIVISNGKNRGEVDIRVRYRWVYSLTKHIGNVKIFVLEDDAQTKADYTEDYWMGDAQKVKNFARKQFDCEIDVVFCGSDYDENSFWNKCYPNAKLEIFDFDRTSISSTKIRNDLYGNWELLPKVVREHFVKKVLIIGCESTGKSTLTENLANYFCTEFLEEVGRDISERSGTDVMMLSSDFTEILLAHKLKEMAILGKCNKVLFEDTDCLITKFFIDFLEDKESRKNSALAEAIAQLNSYDLILYLEPDVKFVQDGDRSLEIANNREKYGEKIKEIYRKNGFNFVSISGDYNARFDKSVSLVKNMLNVNWS